MSFLPLSFGAPMVLWGLLALPVIWWLLRLTPPRPQEEVFPPLRILARVLRSEETPNRSPWWLTLLRLLMAAAVIFALAQPVWNPRERLDTGGGALALVIDNGWASAPDWKRRVATADRLISDAGAEGMPVVLAFTAEKPNAEIGPFDAAAARDRLNAAQPRPVPTDRPAVFARVADALQDLSSPTVAVLSNGLAAPGDEAAFSKLLGGNAARLTWIEPDRLDMIGVTAGDNGASSFTVSAVRAPSAAPRQVTAAAYDERGRRIAETALRFGPGDTAAKGEISVPFEMRNDFSRVAIDGEDQAAATRVLDENSKRRRVGLLAQAEGEQGQPLLSPLYYIRHALEPFADLIEPESADLAESVPWLLERKPAMIVMADIGTLPESARAKLIEWMNNGGTLVRFAGSRLAAAGNDEDLLPVRLRLGERALGGTLSWTEPQKVSEFPANGPFSDLAPPQDVTVSRQVLAEPTPDIVDRTWANLADGTPLVTGAKRGDGTLVLFHVTPEATWSNLPISGTFVEMLRRLVQLSRNQGALAGGDAANAGASLAPYRMISADGRLVPPGPDARPLVLDGKEPAVTIENPPGLYGSEDGVVAHNLLPADASLVPLQEPSTTLPVRRASYAFDQSRDLKGPLIAAALVLMLLDSMAVLWMGGAFNRRRARRAASGSAAAGILLIAGLLVLMPHGTARAQDVQPGDAEAIAAVSQTRIAYVLTGNSSVDSISRAGLEGLRRFLTEKTALEPGEPAGVDIAKDELAFYPLIYWPIEPSAPMPTEDAIARVDAYMQQGGTVLFDTRDQFSSGFRRVGRGEPCDAAAARHPFVAQRAAAGAGAAGPRPDQGVLHHERLSRPLCRVAAVGGGFAERRKQRRPAGAHRRRGLADHDHGQRFRRRLGDRRQRPAALADRACRSAPAPVGLPGRRQHHDVHAHRQLQIRPGARAGAARAAGAVEWAGPSPSSR